MFRFEELQTWYSFIAIVAEYTEFYYIFAMIH
jgi:hypothetical protein